MQTRWERTHLCQFSRWDFSSKRSAVSQLATSASSAVLAKADAGWRSDDRHPGFVRFSAKLRSRAMENGPVSLRYFPLTGTAKYAVLAPVFGSVIALPVISPLSFMSFAVSR